MNEDNILYLDDITGTIGEWMDMDTSDIPLSVINLLQEAYKICVHNL